MPVDQVDWANSALTADQGGSVVLRGPGSPYIEFFEAPDDASFSFRMILAEKSTISCLAGTPGAAVMNFDGVIAAQRLQTPTVTLNGQDLAGTLTEIRELAAQALATAQAALRVAESKP